MAKSTMFAHLIRHSRHHRDDLFIALSRHKESQSKFSEGKVTAAIGALGCLYWQALGSGEILLASKIARTLEWTPKRGNASAGMAQNAMTRTPHK
ncbi:MAG: hypothetical protein ACRCWP_02975 [Shewanella sp.]